MFSSVNRVVWAILIVAAAGCEKSANRPPPPATPATSGHPVPALARPTTQPGQIRPGDWLRVEVPGLIKADASLVAFVRVTADGYIALPLVQRVHVAGVTTQAAARLVAGTYDDQKILSGAMVLLGSVCLQQPDAAPPRSIQPFDLVRVDISGLASAGSTATRIGRVAADGTFAVPPLGPVKIAGMDDSAAEAAIANQFPNKVIATIPIVVTTLEQAPPDAAHLGLPDGPVYPVPEALKPAFNQ